MKKIFRYIYIGFAALIGVAVQSCVDEMPDCPVTDTGVPEGYFFVLGRQDSGTRAEIKDDLTTVAEDGDMLGGFNLGNAGDPENVPYMVKTVEGRKVLGAAEEGRELSKQVSDYLFYYPYDADMTLEKARNLTHTVESDQSTKENFEKSDLLWDVASASANSCIVELDHAMASITVIVQVEANNFFEDVKLLGQSLRASGIDLTKPGIEEMKYDVPDNGSADINAFYAPYSEQGDHYRIVVPANRTLKKGTPVISHHSKRDGEKIFSLKQDLTLRPGYNYTFTLLRKNSPAPDVSDDDSWVLDVIDPETGRPVGLLCREYLVYNQYHTTRPGYDDPTNPASERGVVVNSQAWVFYNLQADGKTPELSTGTVLRFIKDVRQNLANLSDDPVPTDAGYEASCYAWPSPHRFYDETGNRRQGFGMFLADHGHGWRLYDGHGSSSKTWTEHYMHGARIAWHGQENKLRDFRMPELKVTNQEARDFGHIAIPGDGSTPFVSYEPYDADSAADRDGHKVGYTLPHCLVDVRRNSNGDMERRAYPLVKIGFNQFWMSKSFRGKTLTDGTKMACYNVVNKPGEANFSDKIRLDWGMDLPGTGYLYPLNNRYGDDNYADPFSEYNSNLDRLDHELEIPLLYNYKAVRDGRLLPRSVEDIAEYKFPTVNDYTRLHDYLGNLSILKMMTNLIQTRDGYNALETEKQAFYEGKYSIQNSGDLNTFPGNVSGFNLKPYGIFDANNKFSNNGAANFWLYPENPDGPWEGISIVSYYGWNCWSTDHLSNEVFYNRTRFYYDDRSLWKDEKTTWGEVQSDCTFSQVRFFMEFKNQNYGPGVIRSSTRTRAAAPESRTVHVGLE